VVQLLLLLLLLSLDYEQRMALVRADEDDEVLSMMWEYQICCNPEQTRFGRN
jgi:hypothetical protein